MPYTQYYHLYHTRLKEYVQDIAGNPTKYTKQEARIKLEKLNAPYLVHPFIIIPADTDPEEENK